MDGRVVGTRPPGIVRVCGSVAVAEDRIETVKRNFMEIDGDATR